MADPMISSPPEIGSAYVAGMEHDIKRRQIEIRETHKEREQRYGMIGGFFGSPSNAALYIVSFIMILCVGVLDAVALIDGAYRPGLVNLLGALAIAAMGYIGGLLSGGR